MASAPGTTLAAAPSRAAAGSVLAAISVSHLLHDTMQSLVPAIYPVLQRAFDLTFTQIGLLTFALQATASLFQPLVGHYTDRRPQPFSLVAGMGGTLAGLLVLAFAGSLGTLLLGAGLIGLGSAVFHPESSRVARLASGGRHGLAQSIFQVGGNTGSAIGPLLAAFLVVPRGRASLAWCALLALAAIALLWRVGLWYRERAAPHLVAPSPGPAALHPARAVPRRAAPLPPGDVRRAMAVLLVLVFSKYAYLTSLTSFYTFYLIGRFDVPVQRAQIDLFVFLAAAAAGTFAGGPIGDRFGRKLVIWGSVLGVLPFTLLLPYATLGWTRLLTVVIGLVLASAFSAIVVYAQELVPDRIGLVAGLFFGTAFGVAGLGAALLGYVADRTGIEFVYRMCAFLPALGLLAAFLPRLPRPAQR